jgi:hypothetical protein
MRVEQPDHGLETNAALADGQRLDFGIAARDGYFEVKYGDTGLIVKTFKKTRALAAFIIRLSRTSRGSALFQRSTTRSIRGYSATSEG